MASISSEALLRQAVEHAPGEGAVRAATLEREVHEQGFAPERRRGGDLAGRHPIISFPLKARPVVG